jgi:hypothetical protein
VDRLGRRLAREGTDAAGTNSAATDSADTDSVGIAAARTDGRRRSLTGLDSVRQWAATPMRCAQTSGPEPLLVSATRIAAPPNTAGSSELMFVQVV